MYRFFLLIYFLVYVYIQPGYGQAPPAFSFTHYGIENGLASNEIFSIIQNQSGYLWIAANNGLQRFDGVHYKTFRHREQAGNKKLWAANRDLSVALALKRNTLWESHPEMSILAISNALKYNA